jgi:hypothetical protein
VRCGLPLLLALTLLQSGGCQSFVPVSVQVIDAETAAPVSGARVDAYVLTGMTLFAPKPSSVVTDGRGRAVVRVSDTVDAAGRGAAAAAPGYLRALARFPESRFHRLRDRRRPAREVATSSAADLVIELYREPHPSIVLVVPNGYRGLLRLDQSAPCSERILSPRERVVEVSVRSPAPQKLPRVRLGGHFADERHFGARYEDGTRIPSSARDGGLIALRLVTARNMRYVYVVGTEKDARDARDPINDYFRDFERLWRADGLPE